MTRIPLVIIAALAFSTHSAESTSLSSREILARYPYDLGPTTIDTSTYSKRQQKNYATFLRACGQCHTPARAINAPIMSAKGWRYYVFKMRLGSAISPAQINKKEAEAVVSFLTYDAKKRKIDNPTFQKADRRRRVRFNTVFNEKMRRLQKNNPHIRH
jgi:hypothetical protein